MSWNRHNLTTHPLRSRGVRALVPLALGFAFAVSLVGSSAHASLVVSGLPDFSDMAGAAADEDRGSLASQSASDSDRQQQPEDSQREKQLRRLAMTPLDTSTTSSSTTTTSTAGSNASAGSWALSPKASELAASEELIAWLAGEHRLLLPDPPGNELLRPPQAG